MNIRLAIIFICVLLQLTVHLAVGGTVIAPVTNLTAKGVSSHQIEILWNTYLYFPADPILGFSVCLSEDSDPASCEINVPVDPTLSFISVPFLKPFTRYYISVVVVGAAIDDLSDASYTDAMTLERAPSKPPTSVQAVGVSATEIRVTTSPIPSGTENGIILHYVVCFRLVNEEGCTISEEIDANDDPLTLVQGGLIPNTLYRIRVRAFNSAGGGPWSLSDIFVFTGQLQPLSGVEISSFTSTSFTINWNEYVVPGVIVQYYIVCLRRDQSSEECDSTIEVDSSQFSYTVTNLLQSGQYFVTVFPETDVGSGAESSSIFVLGPVDNFSGVVQSSSELYYTWDEYVVTSGTLNGYVICLRKDPSQDGCDVLDDLSASQTTYTATNLDSTSGDICLEEVTVSPDTDPLSYVFTLEPESEYRIRVSAFNDFGVGPSSDSSSFTTGQLASLSGVEVSSFTSTSFTINWNEYVVPGVTVQYYIFSYTVTNLLQSGEYFVTVFPETDVGSGAESSSIFVLGPVDNFSGVVQSSSELYYTWDEYVVTSGTLNGYVICLRKDPSQDGCDVLDDLSASQTTYTATNLDSSTQYYAVIYAQTSEGDSFVSQSVNLATQGGAPTTGPGVINVEYTNTQATVTWIAVVGSAGEEVTGYNLCLLPASGDICLEEVTVSPDTDPLSYVFTLEPESEYRIRVSAFNDFGVGPSSDSSSFTTGQLASLSGVEVSSFTSTSFTINWNEYVVPGVTVQYYIVCLRRDQSSEECDSTIEVDSSQFSYTVTNLLQSGQYFVTVFPETDVGSGAESSSIFVLGPVDNFSGVVQSSSELYYTWDEYVVTSGTLNGYVICLRKDPSQDGCDVLDDLSASQTTYTATNLDSSTQYYAVIYAQTSEGDSFVSQSVDLTTSGGAPTTGPDTINVVYTNTQATVTWTAVTGSTGEEVTGYNLCLLPASGDICLEEVTVSPDTDPLSYVFTLEPESEYRIRVSAFNDFGVGPSSDSSSFTTGQLASLSGVEVSSFTSTSFTINWNEYVVPGVTVQYYIVCLRRDQSSEECDSTIEVDSSQLSYTVTNLLQSGEYFVTVFPETDVGSGAESSSIFVLGPVDNFSGVVQSSSELYYTWDEYVVTSGTLNGYVICLRKDPSQDGCDVLDDLSASQTTYTATNLDSSTQYYAVIYAQTSEGDSFVSQSVNLATQGGAPTTASETITVEVSNTQATVTWTAVTGSVGEEVTGYNLCLLPASGDICLEEVTVSPDTDPLSYVFTLEPESEYRIRISAFNDFGVGPSSDSDSFISGQPICSSATKLDLHFVIDITDSLSQEEFDTEVAIVIGIIENLKREPGNTDIRVGFNFFNEDILFPIPFTSDLDNVVDALNQISFEGGSTNLVAPLDFLLFDVFTDDTRRAGAQRLAVYLTAGEQTVPPYKGVPLSGTVEILRNRSTELGEDQDVRILAIGLGTNLNELQLRAIATDPDEYNYFTFDTFEEAEASIFMITQEICVPVPVLSVDESSLFSLRFSWSTDGLNSNLIENVILCWSESEDDNTICENNVTLSVSEFLVGNYLIEGLESSTAYYITLMVRYFSSQLISNTVTAATTTFTGPTSSQTTPTPTPLPSVFITNAVPPSTPTEFSPIPLSLPIGSTFYICQGQRISIVSEYDAVNPRLESVVTKWYVNEQFIVPGASETVTIDGEVFIVFDVIVDGNEGNLYINVDSKQEILEILDLNVNEFLITFEVSLGNTTDEATSLIKISDCATTTTATTTTTTTTTPTPTPAPSVSITNRADVELLDGISEGAIGSNFSFDEGQSLTVIATYEFQNPNQESIDTRWSYNGMLITSTFISTGTILGNPFNIYVITNPGITGYIYRAVNSNEEFISLDFLPPQLGSMICFEAILGALNDLACSNFDIIAPPTNATTPSATTPSATTPSATTPSATTPSATTPSATTPSATTPSATTPSATTPSATTPSATTPSATTPSATTPSATTPSATTPSATTPSATTPSATTPSATTPSATTPSATTPSATTPSATTPSATTPSATTPSATTPSATTPSATTPSATTPSATTPSATTPSATPPGETMIVITQEQVTIEPDSVQDVEGRIGSSFFVREQSEIRIIADYEINTEEAAESRTSWFYHNTLDGTRTQLEFRQSFLPDGNIGLVVTNAPWSSNSSFKLFVRDSFRTEILEIPTAFPVHEGFFTFRVELDNFPFEEATSEIRITYPPPPTTTTMATTKPTTPAPTEPPIVCTQPLDIYFAIDMSGSLGSVEFFNEIDFVVQIIDSFISTNNRFGYLLFTDEVISTPLNRNPTEVKQQLAALPYSGGQTAFLPVLDEIFNNQFTPSNMRQGVSRILFFLTDGISTGNETEIVERANQLKTLSNVQILSVGFGQADQNTLAQIASDNLNFTFANIDVAREALSSVVEVACPEPRSCCEGPNGFRGDRGPMGFRGEIGEPGKNGICETLEDCVFSGLNGQPGDMGPQGPNGVAGPPGVMGETGPKGFPGNTGNKGSKGESGLNGIQGDKGRRGDRGNDGEPGQKGIKGDEGAKGDTGEQGQKGDKGDTGSIGVCRSSECFGAKGEQGETGQKGSKGFTGILGDDGIDAPKGEKGATGLKGFNGFPGAKGETGEMGDAIEKRTFQQEPCLDDGSLLYDTEINRIYYCSGGRYLCIGRTPCNL
ncbi:hypothetical protein LOD99_13153 [Oopsacas minuta]|uniref:Uncharacterized protein n=1 Tax=Oopsacas minuta TaxID=111878 RepID=A0AAV7JB47_9METZ|nr:hypothetical protein LOD99_13153 [Oopsacas minuta]